MSKILDKIKKIKAQKEIRQFAKKTALVSSIALAGILGNNQDTEASEVHNKAKLSPLTVQSEEPKNKLVEINQTSCLFEDEIFARKLAEEHSFRILDNMFTLNDIIKIAQRNGYKEQLIEEIADYVYKSGGLTGKSNYCVMTGALSAKNAVNTQNNKKLDFIIEKAVSRIFPDNQHSNVSCPKFLEHIKDDPVLSRYLYECRGNLKETIQKVGLGGILISKASDGHNISSSSGLHFTYVGPEWFKNQYKTQNEHPQIVRQKGRINLPETLSKIQHLKETYRNKTLAEKSNNPIYVGANGESSGPVDYVTEQNSGYYFDYKEAVSFLILEELNCLSPEEKNKLPSEPKTEKPLGVATNKFMPEKSR